MERQSTHPGPKLDNRVRDRLLNILQGEAKDFETIMENLISHVKKSHPSLKCSESSIRRWIRRLLDQGLIRIANLGEKPARYQYVDGGIRGYFREELKSLMENVIILEKEWQTSETDTGEIDKNVERKLWEEHMEDASVEPQFRRLEKIGVKLGELLFWSSMDEEFTLLEMEKWFLTGIFERYVKELKKKKGISYWVTGTEAEVEENYKKIFSSTLARPFVVGFAYVPPPPDRLKKISAHLWAQMYTDDKWQARHRHRTKDHLKTVHLNTSLKRLRLKSKETSLLIQYLDSHPKISKNMRRKIKDRHGYYLGQLRAWLEPFYQLAEEDLRYRRSDSYLRFLEVNRLNWERILEGNTIEEYERGKLK